MRQSTPANLATLRPARREGLEVPVKDVAEITLLILYHPLCTQLEGTVILF
jgi:hypothetical protein